ncbi:MAG: glycoside hydrolase family 43 protein [Candidatus Didemnitutus sp.]|nr:glycoside hydrolase family 43 protein [Candidatus Didemnitutus sp.]
MIPRRLALVCCLAFSAWVAARSADSEALLFAYFTQNGADGLHLAWSDDGFRWEKLVGGASVLRPTIGAKEKLIRDPSVARGPDGVFHVVWTSGWWEHGIGYASTRDFVHWSTPREISVMARESAARNCWAPEIVWDPDAAEFLILWATTIPGCFSAGAESSENGLNHRIYYTATKDFATFTPARVLFDFGFSAIDATLLKVGRDWHLFFKDETRYPQPAKNLLHAIGANPRGPFTHVSPPFSPAKLWVEGPSVVCVGDEYLLYFDAYIEKHYGVLRSRDLAHWEDATRQLRLPDEGTPQRPRHGTVIAVPREIVTALQQLKLAP